MNTNQTLPALFDTKFVASTLKHVRICPKCRKEYSLKVEYYSNANDRKLGKKPFLLACGHNMCENCIVQNRRNLCCMECVRPIEIPSNNNHRNNFEINYYLFGLLNSIRYNTSEETIYPSTQLFETKKSNFSKCVECEQNIASGICKKCFDLVHHEDSKFLRTHVLENFETNLCFINGPREKICRIHRKACDQFCLKCQMIICWQCTKTDHLRHGYKRLAEENNSYKDELLSFLEVIKETRENMRKSQKEIKSVANYLRECASEVIQDVNDFFLDLHSFLQLEEQKVLNKFMKCYEEPQRKIHEATIVLNNSHNTLNNIKSQFEMYSKKPPNRVHIVDVIKAATKKLEELPCQVEISKILNKPFIFESRKDSKIEIRKLYSSKINEPNFSLNLEPICTDSNRFWDHHRDSMSMDSEMYTANISMGSAIGGGQSICRKYQNAQQALMRSLNISYNKYHNDIQYNNNNFVHNSNRSAAAARQPLIGLVSHIKNPEHFYIQLKENIPLIRTISEQFVANSNSLAENVKTISTGNVYMIYHINDSLWYRVIVKKTLENDSFKVFLQDFGTEIDVPKNSIYEINDETRAFPLVAKRCGIDNIMPVEKLWNEDSRMLMTEIIENKSVQIILHEEINNNWKVDIYTTHTKEPISVRDSFLYMGLAREKTNRSQSAEKTKTTVAISNQRFKRPHLTMGLMFRTKIVHIENPQEFYAIKMDQYSAKTALCDDLNALYMSKNTNERIYFAKQQIACAAHISSKWHRACVEEIKGGGEIRIRLVDEGCYETVNWRQLFALEPNFLEAKEYAFECCLADVEPLQKEDYIWTDDAIAYFTQMSKNPTIQMTICSSGQSQPFKVTLHITRKDVDSNIGARLVKYNHAVSTGERSSILDLPVTPKFSCKKLMKSTPAADANADADATAATASLTTNANEVPKLTQKKKALQRTPIKIVHIESPGEFYVQLVDFLPGIKNFHQQIQVAQSQLQDSLAQLELKEWRIGDHCLVHTTKTSDRGGGLQQYPEWYRGIISDIDYSDDNERPYVIFLREEGRTIRSIRSGQLASINDIYDRVSNGSHLCHFACVQPTGGLEHWSQTAIDQFKHYVLQFESLSATKQGTQIDGSIPIILWGMQTETNDPLAPSLTRYTNINHLLVVTGLAHFAEKFDPSLQMDAFQQIEPDEGEETLSDWFEKFNKRTQQRTSTAMSISAETDNQALKSYSHDFELDSEGINDVVTGGWLPPRNIEKTLFTAYATYVDDEGFIHLHDADLHDFLKMMRTKINNMFGDTVEPHNIDGDFCVGRPCLARYHLDQHFYRATIKSVQAENTFEVRYIDYGNIESCELNELRMFTPFPNVPTIATKIELDGIRPKNGEGSYSTSVLDKIHSKVVGKMISVRVVDDNDKKLIKKCTIRVDNEDLASTLIACGYVEPNNTDTAKMHSKFRNKNPIVCLESPPSETCPSDENDAIEMEMERKFELVGKLDKDHLNRTERNNEMDLGNELFAANFYEDIADENDFDDIEDDVVVTNDKTTKIKLSPEITERMFSPEAYGWMFEQLKQEKIRKSITACLNRSAINVGADLDDDDGNGTWAEIMKDAADDDALNKEEEEEEEARTGAVGGGGGGSIARNKYSDMADEIDVLELEHSFLSSYWHRDNDADNNHEKSIVQLFENEVDEILSEYDNFIPREASPSFSNFSGIEQFRSPTFPPGVETFTCDVVFIRSLSLIHIFPDLLELHYRELELERSIQLAAKRAPPLHKFNPRTMCIARYSKDQLWYRAVIRSYNVAGKQVEVMYVDFLNSETVPLDQVRRCPSNLISMPLRTFVVKLAGMRPNPRIPSKDIKIALKKCIANRKVYGRLVKTQTPISTNSFEYRVAPAEIIFYETKSSKRPICEDLIENNFYCRK